MKSYCLIVAFIGLVCSLPVEDADKSPADQEVEITEGDMVLTSEQKTSLYKNQNLRNGVRNPLQMWPGGLVYFQFTSTISKLYLFFLMTVKNKSVNQQIKQLRMT